MYHHRVQSGMEATDTVEINLAEFSRDQLEYIIQKSCEEDVSVNKVIESMLLIALREAEAQASCE